MANDSFSKAISSIRWNRINTAIQYFLIALFFVLGSVIFINYRSDKHDACVARNELATVQERNTLAIGAALATMFNADSSQVDRYMDLYREQNPLRDLNLQEC
jgi:hypothetical protein